MIIGGIFIKLLKADKLKEEYCSFFWTRFGLALVLGIIMYVINAILPILGDGIFRSVLNALISYLLASEILRRMINGSNSSLKMAYNEGDKDSLDAIDMLKVYWSFYWREFLLQTGAMLVMGLVAFLLLRGARFFSIMPLIIVFLLIFFVVVYYIGRSVFMRVVDSVWWKVGRIEVETQE